MLDCMYCYSVVCMHVQTTCLLASIIGPFNCSFIESPSTHYSTVQCFGSSEMRTLVGVGMLLLFP